MADFKRSVMGLHFPSIKVSNNFDSSEIIPYFIS
jgi:hypothetical protein